MATPFLAGHFTRRVCALFPALLNPPTEINGLNELSPLLGTNNCFSRAPIDRSLPPDIDRGIEVTRATSLSRKFNFSGLIPDRFADNRSYSLIVLEFLSFVADVDYATAAKYLCLTFRALAALMHL